jgi:hypothetical protein
MAGSGSAVCAASAAATTSPSPLLKPVPKRFCIVSLSISYRLARCFLRGLPTTESSGKLADPKTLFDKVALGPEPVSVSAGGVAPRDVVPIDPGDLRELAFKGSAECWRLS